MAFIPPLHILGIFLHYLHFEMSRYVVQINTDIGRSQKARHNTAKLNKLVINCICIFRIIHYKILRYTNRNTKYTYKLLQIHYATRLKMRISLRQARTTY